MKLADTMNPLLAILILFVLQAQIYNSNCIPPPAPTTTTATPSSASAPAPEIPPVAASIDEAIYDVHTSTTTTPTTTPTSTVAAATSTTATTTTPPVPPVDPVVAHKFDADHFNERAMDAELIQVVFDKPLIYKSFDCMKPLDGKITFVPPKGHGLIAVVQEMSLRTNAAVCKFGYNFYPKCLKCVDYLQFSTPTMRSSKTCGDVDVDTNSVQGRLLTMIGEMSFVGGIDQEVAIKLHQEEAFGLPIAPSFAVSITTYNDCGEANKTSASEWSSSLKKCPPSTANGINNAILESYCIYDELFCDRVVNCPVAGPSSSTYGLTTDESNCAFDYPEDEEEDSNEGDGGGGEIFAPDYDRTNENDDKSYEIKVLPNQEFVKAGLAYRKHTIIQRPELSTVTESDYDENQLPRNFVPINATSTSEQNAFSSTSIWTWMLSIFLFLSTCLLFVMLVGNLLGARVLGARESLLKQGKLKVRCMVPQKHGPCYTRLQTFSYKLQPRAPNEKELEEQRNIHQMFNIKRSPLDLPYGSPY